MAFWSLGVEEKFYLLAPFLLIAVMGFKSRRDQYVALAALTFLPLLLRVFTAASHPEVVTYPEYFTVFRSPFHVTFDGLAVGGVAAFVYRDRDAFAWTKRPGFFRSLFWIGATP